MGVFNKTIIPLALVGYEVIDSQLGTTRLVGYLSSYPTRVRGINVSKFLVQDNDFPAF